MGRSPDSARRFGLERPKAAGPPRSAPRPRPGAGLPPRSGPRPSPPPAFGASGQILLLLLLSPLASGCDSPPAPPQLRRPSSPRPHGGAEHTGGLTGGLLTPARRRGGPRCRARGAATAAGRHTATAPGASEGGRLGARTCGEMAPEGGQEAPGLLAAVRAAAQQAASSNPLDRARALRRVAELLPASPGAGPASRQASRPCRHVMNSPSGREENSPRPFPLLL